MDATQIITTVANSGFPTAIAIFLLYQLPRREEKLMAKIAELEIFQRDTLLALVDKNSDLLGRNQEILDRSSRIMERWENHLDKIDRAYKADTLREQ